MKLRACLLALCVLLASSCTHDRQYRHPHGMPPGQAKQITHWHTDGCGHVCIDGVWVVHSPNPGRGPKASPPGHSKGGPRKK